MTATILRFPPLRTPAEQEAMDLKVISMGLGFDVESHNADILMRTFGVPAMPGTPETDQDPCVPFANYAPHGNITLTVDDLPPFPFEAGNVELPSDCEPYIAPDSDPA